jgi:endonuclease YncB( thermonuclease family)
MQHKRLVIAAIVLSGWALVQWQPALTPLADAAAAMPKICWLATVVDGDTLNLTCQGKLLRVRLHCIDAPEKAQIPWGERSRAALQRITPRMVQVQVIELDRYGRTVAEVFTASGDHRSINLEQVKNGNAAVYARYCDDDRFSRAQQEAKAARRGIWSRTGQQQTPWKFRQRQRQ